MSIKKKFATAVATASLLAGLFGSAFVPSAMAGIYDPTDTIAARYTTLVEEPGLHQAGTAKSFGFQSGDAYDGDGDTDVAIGINLFKSAGNQYNFELDKNDAVPLKAVSSNSNVQLAWAYTDAGLEASCTNTDVEGNFGTSSTFVDVPAADMDNTEDNAVGDVDDVFYLCFAAKRDTTAATSTITVTVDGVVATTFSVTAVGPIASLTASITNGYKYIAEGNRYLDNWLTVIAKDAAGVQINGSATSVSNEELFLADWIDQPENQQGDQISLFSGTPGSLSTMDGDPIGSGTAQIAYDLDHNVCSEATTSVDADGDAGFSYVVKVEDDVDGDIVSNGVTITCTLNSDGARVTAVTPEATSGGKLYNETAAGSDDLLSLVGTVVDEDGRPLGDGAHDVNFGWEFDGDELLDFSSGIGEYTEDYEDRTVLGGEFTLGTLAPDLSRFGRHTYTVTAADSDLAISGAGDDPVAKEFTKTYLAINSASPSTITKVRNAAKTTAVFTADMGEDAAFDTVYFTVELKNGNVVEYSRRANAIGVAKLTLSKRNTTIYVYASYEDDTNVLKCRFR